MYRIFGNFEAKRGGTIASSTIEILNLNTLLTVARWFLFFIGIETTGIRRSHFPILPNFMTFQDFHFQEELLDALYYMKFDTPTPIQEQAIPILQEGRDLIACAQTGTGKTAAFLLPLIDRQTKGELPTDSVHTLIIVPTRELALQIDQQMDAFSYFSGASSMAIYGGGDAPDFEQQKKALKQGAGFIIATPGRLLSHLNLGYVDFSGVRHLVLDEADRMLDMGFYEDIVSIAKHLPKTRQTLLFSATMPDRIRRLADTILTDPAMINIAISKPAEGVLQGAYVVYEKQRLPVLIDLLEGKKSYPSILIFTSTKKATSEIASALRKKGFGAKEMSSDLDQNEREQVMRDFASRKTQILVATDIVARGIDIKEINLVINFDVPRDAEDYVHRVGRTARADKTGVAITFITERDQRDFKKIEDLIDTTIMKLPIPEQFGEGPAYEPNKRRSQGGNRKEGHAGKQHRRGGNHRKSKGKGGGHKRRSKD